MNEPIVEPILAVESEPAFQTNAPLIPRELGRWARACRRHCDHDLSRVLDRGRGLAGRRRLASLALGCVARRDDPGEASAWRRCRKPRRQSRRHRGASARGRILPTLFPRPKSEKLLEPWLGAGLDLSQLPVPRLILVRLRGQGSQNLATLRKALASAVPQADLDDHRVWAARLGTMADAVVILAAALFALMIVAMGTAIGFATRGAMAGNREIIEVLHLVGASDTFIAREFQSPFPSLGTSRRDDRRAGGHRFLRPRFASVLLVGAFAGRRRDRGDVRLVRAWLLRLSRACRWCAPRLRC